MRQHKAKQDKTQQRRCQTRCDNIRKARHNKQTQTRKLNTRQDTTIKVKKIIDNTNNITQNHTKQTTTIPDNIKQYERI